MGFFEQVVLTLGPGLSSDLEPLSLVGVQGAILNSIHIRSSFVDNDVLELVCFEHLLEHFGGDFL